MIDRRRMVLVLALLVGLAATASGEDGCWAGFFDYYYHAAPRCALAGTVSAATRQEAEEQGKLPCPACVDDARRYKGVEAVVRGGTLVIRVPDAWMAKQGGEEDISWFGEQTGREARELLAEQLHGAAYRDFLKALDSAGEARSAVINPDALPCVPDIDAAADGLLMNRRHIGAAWYLTYRPGEADRAALSETGRAEVSLSFEGRAFEAVGDALNVFRRTRWQDGAFALSPRKSKNKTSFKAEYDGLTLAVFTDLDANICVLRLEQAGDRALSDARLLIDGVFQGAGLNGYADGGDAVFCGVLTDGEARALKNGATAQVALAEGEASEADAFAAAFEAALDEAEGEEG